MWVVNILSSVHNQTILVANYGWKSPNEYFCCFSMRSIREQLISLFCSTKVVRDQIYLIFPKNSPINTFWSVFSGPISCLSSLFTEFLWYDTPLHCPFTVHSTSKQADLIFFYEGKQNVWQLCFFHRIPILPKSKR